MSAPTQKKMVGAYLIKSLLALRNDLRSSMREKTDLQ